jgi:hypothetical protein
MDSYLERLHEAVTAATHGMTVDELQRHSPGKWSTAEVLEHLYLSYTGTVKGCDRCLQENRPLAGVRTWKQWAMAVAVTGLGYFPSGRESPNQARPRGLPAEQVLAEIGEKIKALDRAMGECETRLGKGVLMDHPIIGPLTAAQWRKFHWVHGRHHVKQILRMRETITAGGLADFRKNS